MPVNPPLNPPFTFCSVCFITYLPIHPIDPSIGSSHFLDVFQSKQQTSNHTSRNILACRSLTQTQYLLTFFFFFPFKVTFTGVNACTLSLQLLSLDKSMHLGNPISYYKHSFQKALPCPFLVNLHLCCPKLTSVPYFNFGHHRLVLPVLERH